ncbi:MAG TPA: alkaline phosphatase family protein [Rhodothermales bacterium]|nr:alkaline phosphatase family protein [Rhodothermales bacterium]
MRLLLSALVISTVVSGCATSENDRSSEDSPKLVVVIALDQFRWDYFERFMPYFGEGGFRRFETEGAVLSNARFRHAATMTCPGHAAISTGASGNVNGIVANDWYDLGHRRGVYCVEDASVTMVGRDGPGRSPRAMMGETIGDLLKSDRRGSKVFAASGKDRSAITLAGHRADAAYWLLDSVMVSSTYYMTQLPAWVETFNGRRLPQDRHGETWDRVLSSQAYDTTQGPDDFWHEEDRQSLGKAFPHVITGGSENLDWNFYEALRKSPFEDEILLEFVKELIIREDLGQDSATDLLGIGLSTVDRIGHPYGPDSHEIMDNVVRTDRVLADLFQFLDDRVGVGGFLVVLTADHGVQRFPELVADSTAGVLADRISSTVIREDVSRLLDGAFGTLSTSGSWIDALYYPHLYFNREALKEKAVTVSAAADVISRGLTRIPRYSAAVPSASVDRSTPESFSSYPGRSGDILVRLAEHHINRESEFGTTHGTPWEGDQHVPILWFGHSISRVSNDEPWNVVDIAPTVATLLGIDPAETMDGRIISPVIAAHPR